MSDGKYVTLGAREVDDLETAVDYLREFGKVRGCACCVWVGVWAMGIRTVQMCVLACGAWGCGLPA